MLRTVVLFGLVSCVLGGPISGNWEGRIVNGENTTIQVHPYQVSIQTNNGWHFCGGSIISEDIIVTAAHCMQQLKPYQFKIRLGSTEYNKGGEVVAVKAFKYHEKYDPETMINDVAIIKLATPVRQSSRVRYIKLSQTTPSSGTTAVVTGWGVKCSLFCRNSPVVLQEAKVNTIDKNRCSSKEYRYGTKIKDTMLCASGVKKDSCQGDSGGPLVTNNKLIGIVSWGIFCGLEGFPGVYCDVATVRSWIEETAKAL